MSEANGEDVIDDVAAGDVITLHQSDAVQRPLRVVHVDETDTGYLVTLEGDGGETFDANVPAGTRVTRALESKWESPQSPTPNEGT